MHHIEMAFGSDKAGEVEYTALELGMFLEELIRGNPRNIEPLFLDNSK